VSYTAKARVLSCLIAIIAGLSTLAGGVLLLSDGRRPAVAFLLVSVVALVVGLLNVRLRLWRWSIRLLLAAALVAGAGMLASLVYRDDYFGGSCGEADWPSGHLHGGYPFSWLDGHICVPPGVGLREELHQNPSRAAWRLDFPAAAVDALFWLNIGILASSAVGLGLEARARRNSAPDAHGPS